MSDSWYDDGATCLDERGVTLRRYYFPLALAKRIPYDRIRSVQARPMGWLTGRGRGWGTANPRYWFPLDLARPWRHTMIVLDTGGPVLPVFSPREPERVMRLIQAQLPRSAAGGA